MTSSVESQVAAYVQLVGDNFMVNLCSAAATAWLVYDIIITMDQEINYTWRSQWTIPKVLYLIVRYFTLANMILYLTVNTNMNAPAAVSVSCKHWRFYWFFAGPVLTSIFAEALLVIRLCALYHGNRKAIILVIMLYLAETTMNIVSAVLTLKPLPLGPNTLGLPGCSYSHQSSDSEMLKLALGSWSLVAAVTFIYFMLTLVNFINAMYPRGLSGQSLSVSSIPKLAPILYLFVRDGTIYFFIIFVAALLTITLTAIFPSRAISAMGYLWMTVTYSIMSARLYLNLRGAMVGSTTVGGPDSMELQIPQSRTEISNLAFAPDVSTSVSTASV